MDKLLTAQDSNGSRTRKQSFVHPHILTPLTPMTPLTYSGLNTPVSVAGTMVLKKNWNDYGSAETDATATTIPTFGTKEPNSDSYGTTASSRTTTTATTYTNDTINSNRTRLPIIADVNEPEKRPVKSRKVCFCEICDRNRVDIVVDIDNVKQLYKENATNYQNGRSSACKLGHKWRNK